MSALLKQNLKASYPTVERGQGVWLWDSEGKKYFDGSSGAMTANIGHGVEKIADALRNQAENVAFTFRTQFTNQPAELLAHRLVSLAGAPFSHVCFVNSGSEASEHAMRMALQYWQEKGQPNKNRFLTRHRSYHGMTMGALSASGHDARRNDFGQLLHPFPAVPPAYPYRAEWGTLPVEEQAEAAIREWEEAIQEIGSENIAAIMVEPIVGAAAGALVAPEGYYRKLRALCNQNDILLIMDEVITGMGRTGAWFAFQDEEAIPDIITTAKGLSAGYTPMGAIIISAKIVQAIEQGSAIAPFGHTFSGNPLSAAACLAVLDYIDEHEVLENVKQQSVALEAGLRALEQRFRHMADVRGRGLLWGFEFVLDKQTREAPPAQFNASAKFTEICQKNGLIIYPSGIEPLNNAVMLAPPLIVTENEIVELLNLLEKSLEEMDSLIQSEFFEGTS